jgi:hypothetical protein
LKIKNGKEINLGKKRAISTLIIYKTIIPVKVPILASDR